MGAKWPIAQEVKSDWILIWILIEMTKIPCILGICLRSSLRIEAIRFAKSNLGSINSILKIEQTEYSILKATSPLTSINNFITPRYPRLR